MFNDMKDYQGQTHKYVISGMGVNEEPLGVFRMDEQNGTVFALKSVDREQYEVFTVS